jgi:Bardet-Biedl syndrome 2 protein
MSNLVPSFEFKLGAPVCAGAVCVGKLDGSYPCIAAACPNGNVLVHDPRAASNAVRVLSFGRSISGLSCFQSKQLICGKQKEGGDGSAAAPTDDRDVLLIAGVTSAHVFDIVSNSDVFFKDIPDGVSCCVFGSVSVDPAKWQPSIVVGSHCSIQGFAHDGSEMFWTVSGDSVTCIDFAYLDAAFMIVGSKDSFFRVYSGEQLLHEIAETAAPTRVKVVPDAANSRFQSCKWLFVPCRALLFFSRTLLFFSRALLCCAHVSN